MIRVRRRAVPLFTTLAALAAGVLSHAGAGADEQVPAPSEEMSGGAALFAKVDPMVVAIQHENAGGSGFVISPDGHILTNGHVVMDPDPEDPRHVAERITVILHDGKNYRARVLGHCLDPDVALIKIDPESPLTPVEIADSRQVRPGQKVYAFGAPRGLKRTLTGGILSNTERTDLGTFTNVFQTDASINPGNSGGPLFDDQGRVLGLNTYGGSGEGLGMTIPIHIAWTMKDHYLKTGRFHRADLPGLVLGELYADLARALGADFSGVLVDDVLPGSDAARTGFRQGDVITAVDGRPVSARTQAQLNDFNWELTVREPGSRAAFTIRRREGNAWVEKTVEATFAEDEPAPKAGYQVGEIPEHRFDDLGLGIQQIVRLTRMMLRLPDAPGVLVTAVSPGSPAQEAELAANDILTAVDGQATTGPEAFIAAVERACAARQKALVLDVRRGNLSFQTAIAPPYRLAGKRIGVVIPPKARDAAFVRRFLTVNGAVPVALDGPGAPDPSGLDALLLLDESPRAAHPPAVTAALKALHQAGKPVGAVGPAVAALAQADGLFKGKKVTTDEATAGLVAGKCENTGKDVETDGRLVTATGENRKVLRAFLDQFRKSVLQAR